ncbi:uncharacterized protein LOC111401531 isoform X3 [Olea europaea var. sylvestris]|uniref:uncharacterized protein LOC111401531 isoform X3 n=1 Tax=Olea europaea var. sylvestris TaxID=158386 RepID=UPI000C1D331A|nr:uncharacterized protein LOC111401531 isoform X3 [Olea europaea var. sylvestris]
MSSTLRFPLPSSIINYAPPSHLASPRFCRILNVQFFAKRHLLRLCTVSTNNSVHESTDEDNSSVEKSGSMGKDESQQALSPNEFYVSPAPARMGYLAAVERFLKVMAMVWAGSQVTKLVRAGG